jgi:hypothetical protein
VTLWVAFVGASLLAEGVGVENALLMLAGIALVVWIVVPLDWLGRRKERQSRNRAA